MTVEKYEDLFRENQQIIAFFSNHKDYERIPERILLRLIPISKYQIFAPGDIILEEGQDNRNLYFLMDGCVEVFVAGESVAKMSDKGNMIGEMSVISESPCSATVVAVNDVELLTLDIRNIDRYEQGVREQLEHAMFRIFSSILATKLKMTNTKARSFETTNRQLEQAQTKLEEINLRLEEKVHERTLDIKRQSDELLSTNHELEQQNTKLNTTVDQFETLIRNNEQIVKHVRHVHDVDLARIIDNLERVCAENRNEANVRSVAVPILDDIRHLREQISPITTFSSRGLGIRNQRVLLAEDDRKQQIIAQMALGGTGVILDIASDETSAEAFLDAHDYDIVCLNARMMKLVEKAEASNPNIKSIFMTGESPAGYLHVLRDHPTISNIVSRNDSDRSVTLKNILTTVGKIASGDIFGLEKYLFWGVDVQEVKITNSRTRSDDIKLMENYLSGLGVRARVLARAAMIAEELLMNVVYDAPSDANGKALFNHLDRRQDVDLTEDQAGLLRYACDGMFIAISASDPFGRFDRELILDYLDSCYTGHAGEMNVELGKGGGGMGLFQMMNMADLMVINVKKNVRTEVIAFINLEGQQRSSPQATSFHYFLV